MLDDKILIFFKKNEDRYVSGEELSSALGISRTAVWKHIEKLRDEGYEIIASPHLGYRLMATPDRLTEIELKWRLNSDIIGKKIYSYDKITSTNDAAYKLALSGEKEGTVVTAEYQTKGRGRLGRKWISPKGKGIYLSVILRPDVLPREVSMITLFSALSVAKTIREETGLQALIKWPNDVLVRTLKVSGILTELNAETDKVNFVIAGIGININTKKELLPKGATSLFAEKGCQVLRIDFARKLLKNLDKYYAVYKHGKLDRIVEEHKKLSAILDKRVQVNYHNQSIFGHALDVDREGALILRLDSGFNERVLAGDVLLLR